MNAMLRAAAVLTLLALGGCALQRPVVAPAANGTVALPPDQLIALVKADADRIDRSKDAAERSRLLATATANAQQCVAVAPDNGACHYEWAQVLGLTARERPVQAVALLKDMLASLKQADALDPALDYAGPARLTAVVLLRAPGWPLGPGDPDAALVAAQRAVDRDPAYPPNLITLAQAQAKTDATAKARASYEQARLAIAAWAGASPDAAADRASWQHDIEQGLHDLP
jgi:tetratricopeptide (TPR) repeat protein